MQGGGLLVFQPAGGFAFLPTSDPNKANSTDADIVTVYSVDPNTGALSSTGTFSSQVQNPRSAAMDPLGKYLYVLGSETGTSDVTAQIAGFSINAKTGALSPLSGSPFPIGSQVSPAAIAVDPITHFIYVAGSSATTGSAMLSIFSIEGNSGALSELSNSPFSAGAAASYAVSMSLDPSGAFAYVLTAAPTSESTAQQTIQVFSLDAATGTAALINTQMLATFPLNSPAPISTVAISPAVAPNQADTAAAEGASSTANPVARAKFLYVTNPADGSVLVFSIDQTTGLLSSVSATATGKN
jgi:6-phosphogluconolactonase (cycloisomerase 2 family)